MASSPFVVRDLHPNADVWDREGARKQPEERILAIKTTTGRPTGADRADLVWNFGLEEGEARRYIPWNTAGVGEQRPSKRRRRLLSDLRGRGGKNARSQEPSGDRGGGGGTQHSAPSFE